jgi:hypothetical protein
MVIAQTPFPALLKQTRTFSLSNKHHIAIKTIDFRHLYLYFCQCARDKLLAAVHSHYFGA